MMSESDFKRGIPVLKPGECIVIKNDDELVSVCNEGGEIKVKRVEKT